MTQTFIDKLLYGLFVVTIIFAVILHDISGFKTIDEICGLVLIIIFVYTISKSNDWEINKAFLATLFIFGFYFCYSLWIGSNSKSAIIMDLVIQMKPYMAFFCFYQLKPKFTNGQRLLLKQIMLAFWFLLLPLGLVGFIYPPAIKIVMKHQTYFAGAITAISLVYLYCSDYTKKDKLIFIVMLTIGLASGRSKFYGFYALAIFATWYFSNPSNLKLNAKNISAILCTLLLILFVAREKVMYYFGAAMVSNDLTDVDYLARFALYATSFKIFGDYFPFGSGLASFATHASGYYYSPIYSEYGIDNVWGISKQNWSFIADTYYPSLAQFGIVGAILFFFFWGYLLKKAYVIFNKTLHTKTFSLVLLVAGYCLIENVADASFTSNRGFFMLMFLGLIISDGQRQAINKTDEKDITIIKN
ncbi:MAG: O-antigen ligase domain-containing protein [Tannerellaceae bacterium]